MDSGASFHATHNSEALQNLVIGDFGKVRLADNRTLDITGMGDIVLKTPVGFSVEGRQGKSCHGLRKKERFVVRLPCLRE